MLSVSVVIPIRNAARTLPHCLAALERLEPAPLEIILVNNGSTDESPKILCDFAERYSGTARVIDEPQRGISRARNAGIREAKGEILAWTDSDCAPSPDWLRLLTEPFSDSEVGGVAGRVLAAPANTLVELFCGLYTFQTPDQSTSCRRWTPWTGGYAGANFAARRALTQKLGGYDETIMNWGDDYDFCARLYANGRSIVYTPEARVYHYHRATVYGMMHQAFGQGRSHPYLLRRHASRGLWLDLPRFSFTFDRCPIPTWINLASADKKVLAVMVLGALYVPALLLLVPYAFWLVATIHQRVKQAGIKVSVTATFELAGLLLLKSSAITLGRWWGSVKYGALCV